MALSASKKLFISHRYNAFNALWMAAIGAMIMLLWVHYLRQGDFEHAAGTLNAALMFFGMAAFGVYLHFRESTWFDLTNRLFYPRPRLFRKRQPIPLADLQKLALKREYFRAGAYLWVIYVMDVHGQLHSVTERVLEKQSRKILEDLRLTLSLRVKDETGVI